MNGIKNKNREAVLATIEEKSSSESTETLTLELSDNDNDPNTSNVSNIDSTCSEINSGYSSGSSAGNQFIKNRKKRKFNKITSNWNYFEIINDKEAVCKICNKTVKTSGNSTNINKHMKRKHPLGKSLIRLF